MYFATFAPIAPAKPKQKPNTMHLKKYRDCDELYFRDYLNENHLKAVEYEKLKLELFNKYKPNRDLYTDGKKEFVNEIVNLAREKYKDKY